MIFPSPFMFQRLTTVLLFFVTACTSGYPTNTPTPLPTLSPIPDWLMAVHPAPGSCIALEWFRANLMPDNYMYEGSRPVDRFGYQSNICLLLDVGPLLQSEDKLLTYSDVIRRSSLNLEGKILVPHLDQYWAHPDMLYEYPQLGSGTVAGAPFWLCWPASITSGIYKTTYQFQQTDGNIQEFSWLFEITEH